MQRKHPHDAGMSIESTTCKDCGRHAPPPQQRLTVKFTIEIQAITFRQQAALERTSS